jgi:branched-chain amino acid aminotransferase
MKTRININGIIKDDACVSVFDHGFLFGDSIYEVVNTRKNRPCFLDEHLKRLHCSALGIDLAIPFDDSWFREQINLTLSEAGNSESYIRIVVTRGIGDINIDPSSCASPLVLIYVTPAHIYPSEWYEKGIDLATVSIQRNSKNALNPGIKTGNYLNNVLAKIESRQLGTHDALMLNSLGHLTESTTSNLFFVRDGGLMTPSLECGILAGITRDIVIRLGQENGFRVEEGSWPIEILENTEEIFLTGSVKHLMPVTRLDGKLIGDGKPGPITRSLTCLYETFLERCE